MRATSKATVKRAKALRRAMSPPEVILWNHLRQRPDGFKFRRQHPVGRYVADFYCPPAKLVIEIDGDAHDFAEVAERDLARDDALRAMGLTVLRIPAAHIFADADCALAGILDAVRGGFAPPPSACAGRSPSP